MSTQKQDAKPYRYNFDRPQSVLVDFTMNFDETFLELCGFVYSDYDDLREQLKDFIQTHVDRAFELRLQSKARGR